MMHYSKALELEVAYIEQVLELQPDKRVKLDTDNITDEHAKEIGERIKWIRSSPFMGFKTQSAFARALGVQPSVISRLENGFKSTFLHLSKIAMTTGLSFTWLVLGTGEPYKGDDDNLAIISSLFSISQYYSFDDIESMDNEKKRKLRRILSNMHEEISKMI